MELFHLSKLDHELINSIHDKIKHILHNVDNLSTTVNRNSLHVQCHYELDGLDYFVESSVYKNKFFYVIISMDYEYLFSIGNMIEQEMGMEFYNDNDEPYLSIPFPDEFTMDSYFNLSTVHDLMNIPLDFMKDSKELYNILEKKFEYTRNNK